MSNTKILVSTRYNEYFEVSPALLQTLLDCPVYIQSYESGYKYKPSTEKLDINIVGLEDYVSSDVETLKIEDILAENNRLSREIEALKTKLEKIEPSTELTVL